MAKRLTGTEKWDKAWFRKLSPRHKALWEYLRDKCDQAGMWEVDFDSASHYINDITPITKEDIAVFGNRIEWHAEDKIWITGFVDFQCGELSRKCAAHKPVFKLLTKYNLLDRVLNRLSNSLQEIEKEIEKEEERELEKEVPQTNPPEALDLTDAICDYFDVKTIVTSKIYNTVCDYVSTITHRNELQIASMALKHYIAYKARSQEQRHNITSWIGTKDEHYQDGQWVMIDWDLKNKKYNEKQNDRTTNQGTSTPAGSVIKPGKSFGNIRSHKSG